MARRVMIGKGIFKKNRIVNDRLCKRYGVKQVKEHIKKKQKQTKPKNKQKEQQHKNQQHNIISIFILTFCVSFTEYIRLKITYNI